MGGLAKWRHLIVIGAGYLASLVAFGDLPGFTGTDGELWGRLDIALVLPTAALGIYAAVRGVWARDSVRDAEGGFEPTYSSIVFAVVLFLMAIHLILLVTLTGVLADRSWVARATVVFFGLLMVRIGDLLPRTRPNLAFGIRTPGTLNNRGLWMRIHRMAGYLTVGLGLIFVMSGAFLSQPTFDRVMGSAMLVTVAIFVISYLTYSLRRHA